MNSSRHERAALVAVAYGIGIITSFIGYGTSDVSTKTMISYDAGGVAAVVSALPVEKPQIAVTYEQGVLKVSSPEGERTLSFNPDISGLPSLVEFEEQGIHYGKLAHVASESLEYVFFCEMKQVQTDSCTPFIYDVLTDGIYPVTVNDEKVDMLQEVAQNARFDGPMLVVQDVVSQGAKPWNFSVSDF